MNAKLIDGKAISAKKREEIRQKSELPPAVFSPPATNESVSRNRPPNRYPAQFAKHLQLLHDYEDNTVDFVRQGHRYRQDIPIRLIP